MSARFEIERRIIHQMWRMINAGFPLEEVQRRIQEQDGVTITIGDSEQDGGKPLDVVNKVFEKFGKQSAKCSKSEEECTICLNQAEQPVKCVTCRNQVGCLECCKTWAKAKVEQTGKASCPLGRATWDSEKDVKDL